MTAQSWRGLTCPAAPAGPAGPASICCCVPQGLSLSRSPLGPLLRLQWVMEEPICTAGHLSGLVHAGPREAQAEQQPAERKGLPALESSVFVLSQEVLFPWVGRG